MNSEQRKAALLKEYAIVQATIDYFITLHGRTIVYDGDDIIGHYYRQEKKRAEKYFQEHKRSRLQQLLKKLTKSLAFSMDTDYAVYIKDTTGYTIDLFEELQKNIQYLISQEEIRTKQDWEMAGRVMHFCEKTNADKAITAKLNQLIQNYIENNLDELTRKKRNERREVISRSSVNQHVEIVEIRISTGPKPKHKKEWEILSPDKKLKLHIIQTVYRKSANTYVNIHFPETQGCIYSTHGIHDIKAYWKDNSTIVIHTNPDHQPTFMHKKVESFDDIVYIEYLAS